MTGRHNSVKPEEPEKAPVEPLKAGEVSSLPHTSCVQPIRGSVSIQKLMWFLKTNSGQSVGDFYCNLQTSIHKSVLEIACWELSIESR